MSPAQNQAASGTRKNSRGCRKQGRCFAAHFSPVILWLGISEHMRSRHRGQQHRIERPREIGSRQLWGNSNREVFHSTLENLSRIAPHEASQRLLCLLSCDRFRNV